MTDHKAPKISVIMNALNAEQYLKEAIDSVYAQTHKDWEIIFWDNASTDNTAKIAQTYDQHLLYFRGEDTVPLGEARNLAISKASGEYVAFLDCDDLWVPEKMAMQEEILEANPEIALVYSDCFYIDSAGNKLRKFLSDDRKHSGNIAPQLFLDCFIPCLTVMVRKSVLEEVGLFNTGLTIAEDYDLFLRIAEKYKMECVDLPLAAYRLHDNNAMRDLRNRLKEENDVLNKCILRHPEIKELIGTKGIRIRKAGLRCNLGHLYLLQGNFAQAKDYYKSKKVPLREALVAGLIYSASLGGHNFVMTSRKIYQNKLRNLLKRI